MKSKSVILAGFIAVSLFSLSGSVTQKDNKITKTPQQNSKIVLTNKGYGNSSNDACTQAIEKLRKAEADALAWCQRMGNDIPVPPPPDRDPICPPTDEDMRKESVWINDMILEREAEFIRGIIGAVKECAMNCTPDTFSAHFSDGPIIKLFKRMEFKQKKLKMLYARDRLKFAQVVRAIIRIEKELTMLGYDHISGLTYIPEIFEWAYNDVIMTRLLVEHDYRVNLNFLVQFVKQATMLGSDLISLEDMMEKYWKIQQYELTINIDAFIKQPDEEITGLDYKIQGKVLLYLNEQAMFEDILKEVWETKKQQFSYVKRELLAGEKVRATCQSSESFKVPIFFEFLPDCERFQKNEWEVGIEFERFAGLYETMFMQCIGPPEECKTEPSKETVTMPDGTIQTVEKFANGDGKITNGSNPVEALIRGALVDTIEAAQKRAAREMENSQSTLRPPMNMNDTAAYAKFMKELQQTMDKVRQAKNIRFYPELQNKNAEAVNFVFRTSEHIKAENDGNMDVTIRIKLEHKPGTQRLIR